MDKDYMLKRIRDRIKELELKIRNYFDTTSGPSRSYSGAACMRSRITKDLGTLKLLEYILMYTPDTMFIESKEITDAFDRLVEPKKSR